jgi:hypothetical protein
VQLKVSSAFGIAVGIAKREHMAISWFTERLPPFPRKVVDVISLVLLAAINILIFWHSLNWIGVTGSRMISVLQVPRWTHPDRHSHRHRSLGNFLSHQALSGTYGRRRARRALDAGRLTGLDHGDLAAQRRGFVGLGHTHLWKRVVDDPAHPAQETIRSAEPGYGILPDREPVRRSGPKIGPNEPCPCGSGRKYKKCCRIRWP